MPVKTRSAAKAVTPELLALTNPSGLTSLFLDVERRCHPTIQAGSSVHQRLRAIVAFCNTARPPADSPLRCVICGGRAEHVGYRSQSDGNNIIIGNLTYCEGCRRHTPFGINTVPIRLTLPPFTSGQRARRDFLTVARRAFGLRERLTAEDARAFFDGQIPPPSRKWWVEQD